MPWNVSAGGSVAVAVVGAAARGVGVEAAGVGVVRGEEEKVDFPVVGPISVPAPTDAVEQARKR